MQRWMMRSLSTAAVAAACACSVETIDTGSPKIGGDAGADGGDDAGLGNDAGDDGGAAPDGPFTPAAHTPFPAVEKHSGKVLATPHLVTITFDGYDRQKDVEDFGAFLVASQWLDAVGKDYGVGKGMHTAARIPTAAPAKITDAEITALIDARITDGTLPAPPASGNSYVYMLYTPHTTQVDGGQGLGILCGMRGAVGYHSFAKHGNIDIPYAVVADCDAKLGTVTSTSSHELIEVATDAYDTPNEGYFVDPALPSLWYAAYPNEVGDLCQFEDDVFEGPWEVQRSWSMSAAAAGLSPCVPAPAGEVYYNTTASPDAAQTVPAGGSATFTMTAWSTAPHAKWKLAIEAADTTDFDPQAVLGANVVGNGDTVQVTLTAPASAKSGQVGAAYVESGTKGHFWPVAIVVK